MQRLSIKHARVRSHILALTRAKLGREDSLIRMVWLVAGRRFIACAPNLFDRWRYSGERFWTVTSVGMNRAAPPAFAHAPLRSNAVSSKQAGDFPVTQVTTGRRLDALPALALQSA